MTICACACHRTPATIGAHDHPPPDCACGTSARYVRRPTEPECDSACPDCWRCMCECDDAR